MTRMVSSPSLTPGLFADLGVQRVLTAVANDFKHNLSGGGFSGDHAIELHRRRNRLTVDCRDHVILAKTGASGRRRSLSANHKHSARVGRKLQQPANVRIDVAGLDPKITASHPASLDELGQNRFESVDWNCEAQTLRALEHQRIYSDDLALDVQKRPSRVSRIDRGICLQEIVELPAETRAAFRAYNSQRHRVIEPKWIPDGDDPFTDSQRVAVAQVRDGKLRPRRNDLEQRDVGDFIITFYRGRKLPPIVQRDSDACNKFRGLLCFGAALPGAAARFGARDQMKVGCNESALIDDETASETLTGLGCRPYVHDYFVDALGDRRNIEQNGLSLRSGVLPV